MRHITVLFLFVGIVAASAQAPAKRTVLQRTDVTTTAPQETIFGTVEIAPGSGNGMHTHFGSEIEYVLQGHVRLEIQGLPSCDKRPNDSNQKTHRQKHRSVLLGDEPVKLVNTW